MVNLRRDGRPLSHMSNWAWEYQPVTPGGEIRWWKYPEGGRFISEYGLRSAVPEAVAEVESRVPVEVKGGEQVGGLSQIQTLRIRPMPAAPVGVPLKVTPAPLPTLPPWWAVAGIGGAVIVGGALALR